MTKIELEKVEGEFYSNSNNGGKARKVYISKELEEIIINFKKFSHVKTKVGASRALAQLFSRLKVPVVMMFRMGKNQIEYKGSDYSSYYGDNWGKSEKKSFRKRQS